MVKVKYCRKENTLRFLIDALSLPQEINDRRGAPVDTDGFQVAAVQFVKADL